MGKNIWLPEDWILSYGWKPSQEQLRQVAEFPWGEDVLSSTCPLCGKRVLNCHFAFLGLDRLNDKLLAIVNFDLFNYWPSDDWYSKEKFATKTTMSLRWYLHHTNIVPKSEDKIFDVQKAMLPEEYEVPYAVSEFAKNLLIFKKIGVYANPSRYARCADLDSDGRSVLVGYFSDGVSNVEHYYKNNSNFDIGISASRKIPK